MAQRRDLNGYHELCLNSSHLNNSPGHPGSSLRGGTSTNIGEHFRSSLVPRVWGSNGILLRFYRLLIHASAFFPMYNMTRSSGSEDGATRSVTSHDSAEQEGKEMTEHRREKEQGVSHHRAQTGYHAKDALRPRRKKARRACYACQRAHLTCGMLA